MRQFAIVTTVTYTDKTVKSGTTYYYSVRCLYASGAYIGAYNTTGKSIAYKK